LLKYFLKRLSQKIGIPQPPTNKASKNTSTPKKETKKSKTIVGEYIDFEEID